MPSLSLSSLTLSHVQHLLKPTFLALLLCLSYLLPSPPPISFPHLILLSLIPAFLLLFLHHGRKSPAYLLDFSCYLPPSHHKCNLQLGEHFVRRTNRYSPQSLDFMRSIFLKSGLGPHTYLPPFFFPDTATTANGDGDGDYNEHPANPTGTTTTTPPPPRHHYEATLGWALTEAQQGMFTTVDTLLSKTNIDPAQIGYLVVTCGSFSPEPSLTSLLVNRYKFDPAIKEYNLSGMGCGSGVLAIDLAARLVGNNNNNSTWWWNRIMRRQDTKKMKKNAYALVVITENISLNWYFGDNRSMLVTNCIFRVGCAAAIVTSDRSRAKFKLLDSLRTHHGSDDSSYRAAIQEEDEQGNTGVSLTKDLIRVAGTNLRTHIHTLAPRVLPLTQLITYAKSLVLTKLNPRGTTKPIVPDFTTAFHHICIHTGGKAVIEQVTKVLRLDGSVTEPARMTLHRFGNTSSSLVLYELAYFEAKKRVKKGDKMWMLAFGTGFKVGSLVWKAVRDLDCDGDNPWRDCIDRYPLKTW